MGVEKGAFVCPWLDEGGCLLNLFVRVEMGNGQSVKN